MDIAGAIREVARATAEWFGYKREKATRENAPDVRAAEVANDQSKNRKEIANELAEEDLDAVRRRNAGS